MADFKVGDIVRGKEGVDYLITDDRMHKAKVTAINPNNNVMELTILEHADPAYIGQKYNVVNTSANFELIKFPQPISWEDLPKYLGKPVWIKGVTVRHNRWAVLESLGMKHSFGETYRFVSFSGEEGIRRYINDNIYPQELDESESEE